MAIFTAGQKLVTGIDNFSLLSVPFFILAGILMTNGGIAERLVNFAKVLVGRMPGSLAHTNVVGNMLFGSISGSSVAAAVAIGGVMGPMQKKEGYDPRFSAATAKVYVDVLEKLNLSELWISYQLLTLVRLRKFSSRQSMIKRNYIYF